MGSFAFGGTTIVEPGILVDTTLGASTVLQLLPLGTIAMFGASDGGAGGGTTYRFADINVAQRLLRGGPLLDALQRASSIGGSSGFVAVVLGNKTPALRVLGNSGTPAVPAVPGTATPGPIVPGSQVVTPVSMAGIIVGQHVTVDAQGPGQFERVAVTATTATTFTATFGNPHAAGVTIQANPGGSGGGTFAEAITAGQATVTPSSTNYLESGDQIVVEGETVVITLVNGGTQIEATFAQNHAAGVAFTIIPIDTTGSGETITGGTPEVPASGSQGVATLTSGDSGEWTNDITVECIAGSAEGSVAFVISYLDATSGQRLYIGGLNTALDNITLYSQFATAILANTLLTPPVSTGLPPIVVLTVETDGLPALHGAANLAGGTGGGTQPLAFSDVKAGVDGAIVESFDIGHLVQVYDAVSQTYADAQAVAVSVNGNLRRFVHQAKPTGTSPSQTKVQNSAAVVNAGITNANAIDSIRSSVCAQQISYADPNTGVLALVDAAPFICGMAALLGATGPQGPASPLTYEIIPGAQAVDYAILSSTGDMALAITQGVMALEQIGTGSAARVRIKQSVTTAPLDANGNAWIFAEFSVVRASDAVLANVKAAVEGNRPKIVGGGNVVAVMNSALADVQDVLEDALDAAWIVGFDPASITIYQTGATGEDDIVKYDMLPTLPLNHLGIGQNLLPYSAIVSLGGTVSG